MFPIQSVGVECNVCLSHAGDLRRQNLFLVTVESAILFAFEFCCAVFQFYNLIVQSSHAVSNPTVSFQILLFTFLVLLAYAIIIRFRMLCSSKSGTSFIWPSVPWGPETN